MLQPGVIRLAFCLNYVASGGLGQYKGHVKTKQNKKPTKNRKHQTYPAPAFLLLRQRDLPELDTGANAA